MTDTTHVNKKNPAGAAVLSALFPGVGLFYTGNYVKGIAYLLAFISLIVLASNGRGHEIVVFILMTVGFYIFQIFDTFEDTRKNASLPEADRKEQQRKLSLFAAVAILTAGVLFQLESMGLIHFRFITRMWPLLLIGLGGKYVYGYWKDRNNNQGEENE